MFPYFLLFSHHKKKVFYTQPSQKSINCKCQIFWKSSLPTLPRMTFLYIHRSKFLTDQQRLCLFLRKRKTVKNLKTATIKHVIIHLSNVLKCFFRKKSLCIFFIFFWSKNGKYPTQIRTFTSTTVDYPVYSRSHFLPLDLNGKKCWFANLLSSFCAAIYQWYCFRQRVRGFASHQCKFHFDSMYGGLDMPYDSNNMKIDMVGSLDIWITCKR